MEEPAEPLWPEGLDDICIFTVLPPINRPQTRASSQPAKSLIGQRAGTKDAKAKPVQTSRARRGSLG